MAKMDMDMDISSISQNELCVDDEISLKITAKKESEDMNTSYDENTCQNRYSLDKVALHGYDNLLMTVVKDTTRKTVSLLDDDDLNITQGSL
jgi:hypothetical protein